MAFLPMIIDSGGLDETVLWTNPSPTSAFAGQTITLSDNVDNYDYLEFEYKPANNLNTTYKAIFSIATIKDSVKFSGTQTSVIPACLLGSYVNSGSNATRLGRAITMGSTNNTLTFNGCLRFGSSGEFTSYSIPIKITGIKL